MHVPIIGNCSKDVLHGNIDGSAYEVPTRSIGDGHGCEGGGTPGLSIKIGNNEEPERDEDEKDDGREPADVKIQDLILRF